MDASFTLDETEINFKTDAYKHYGINNCQCVRKENKTKKCKKEDFIHAVSSILCITWC